MPFEVKQAVQILEHDRSAVKRAVLRLVAACLLCAATIYKQRLSRTPLWIPAQSLSRFQWQKREIEVEEESKDRVRARQNGSGRGSI